MQEDQISYCSGRSIGRRGFGRVAMLALAVAGLMVLPAHAQSTTPAASDAPHKRLTIWDLKLGSSIAQMPVWIEFKGYACGSDGGPPLERLSGWADFGKCKAGANGLHEVYFEYDDEAEYIARAHEDIRLGRDIGTVDKSFPIVASALFNDAGILKGVRLVTDPRLDQQPGNEFADLHPRGEHYLLGGSLASQFSIDPSTGCKTIPLGPKESAVGSRFVKLDCERTDEAQGVRYRISTRYYRKPGQAARDPHTGELTVGQFESLTWAEVVTSDVPEEPGPE